MPKTLTSLKFPLGYGTYGAGGAYGTTPVNPDMLYEIILAAYQQGVCLIDTAPVYGKQYGESEQQVGICLQKLFTSQVCARDDLFIMTKCGLRITDQGYRVVNSYEEIMTSCAESLQRLQLETIDLFFLHRHHKDASIEEIADAMSELIAQQKIRYVGLSEAHETTIRAFHAAMKKRGIEKHFIALQSEYSLTNHFVADALLPVCSELGLQFFAYSPFAKGFLTDRTVQNPSSIFHNPEVNYIPQLSPEHEQSNVSLLASLKKIADEAQCSVAQLSLAWLMRQPSVIPLMSTSKLEHLLENIQAKDIQLADATMQRIASLPSISGSRSGDLIYSFAEEMRPYSPSYKFSA